MLVKRYIYCTSSEYATFYKIGITNNLQRRIREANTYSHPWAIQNWKYEFAIEVETEYDGGNYYEREITLHETLVCMGATRIGIKEQFTNLSLDKIRQLFKTMSTKFIDPLTAPLLHDEEESEEETELDLEDEPEPEPESDTTKCDCSKLTNYLSDGQRFQVRTKFRTNRPPEYVDVTFYTTPTGWQFEFPDENRFLTMTEVVRYARFLTGASEEELGRETKAPIAKMIVNGLSIHRLYAKRHSKCTKSANP
jgi:hypothetical protein